MAERPVIGSEPSSGQGVPTRLVEHPKARYMWFGGFAALGIALIVFGVDALGSSNDGWVPVVLFGTGLAALAVGPSPCVGASWPTRTPSRLRTSAPTPFPGRTWRTSFSRR